MIEIKNIVKTLSPERNPSTRLKTDNLRYSAFSAELENPWKLGTPRDTVYPWGKGAHKQKSEHYRPRQCDFKNEACDAYAPSRELAKNLENPSNSRLFRREFFLGSPRDTVYPWGLWSPFYSAINVIIGVFKRYLWCGT